MPKGPIEVTVALLLLVLELPQRIAPLLRRRPRVVRAAATAARLAPHRLPIPKSRKRARIRSIHSGHLVAVVTRRRTIRVPIRLELSEVAVIRRRTTRMLPWVP